MSKPGRRNPADVNQWLATGSVGELLVWHTQLRQNLKILTDDRERKEAMDLLMDIEKKLLVATREQLNAQTDEYKELLEQIKNQKKK